MTARVGVIVLAAGRGNRFDATGGAAKVLAQLNGAPLVRTVAQTALASRAAAVAVVTGPAHSRVVEALQGLQLHIVRNPDFATGLSSSLRVGIRQATADIDGMLVMLGDMPLVQYTTLDILMSCFDRAPDSIDAVVPLHEGLRGNPVLIGKRLFPRIATLSGDEGARRLLQAPDLSIEECRVDDPGVSVDIDTWADLDALRQGKTGGSSRTTTGLA